MSKFLLYGTPVCKKCYYAFANRRQFAYLIDMVILQVLSLLAGAVAGLIVTGIFGELTPEQAVTTNRFFMLLGFVVGVLFGVKDGFGGKSPGKLICRVTCMNEETYRPAGLKASFIRNLITNIPLAPLYILYKMTSGPRPGDGFAKTRVIWDKYRDSHVFNPNAGSPENSVAGFSDPERMPMPVDSSNPYQPPATS